MDLYYPPNWQSADVKLAAVILVTGHADPVMEAAIGCKLKDTEAYKSWARLLAVSGVVAITYTNRNPETDIGSVVGYLKDNAESLSIDVERLGIWSCSANVPNALALLISRKASISCAAFLYGFMLDRDGQTYVTDSAAQSGFAAPNKHKTIDDIPADIALRIIRAGADKFPGINQTIDDFCSDALARNLPVTLVNHPLGPHSFDVYDDSDLTKEIFQDTLNFLVFHLRPR